MNTVRSATEAVNMALDFLRMETISHIDAATETAEVAKRHFQTCYDAVLQEYPWSFAKRAATLSLLKEPAPPWRNAYAAPADLLAPVRLIHSAGYFTEGTLPFEMRLSADGTTRVICSDDDGVLLEYITTNTTLSMFSPLAMQALVYRLAMSLGGALKHNLTDLQLASQAYQQELQAAKNKDAESRSYPTPKASGLNDARIRGLPPGIYGTAMPRAMSWDQFNRETARKNVQS